MKKIKYHFQKSLILFCLVLTASYSRAQTDSAYTLQQCIDYALKNNTSVKSIQFEEYIAKAQAGEYRGIGLPQVNASANLIDNPRLQRFFLFNDPNNPGFASGFFQPGTPEGVYAVPNLFQLRSAADAKLSATQILFNGSYFVGLQAAKSLVELSKRNTVVTKTTVVESVTKAFYLVLINEERKKNFDTNIAQLDSMLRELKEMNKQGFVEKLDVDRLEVALNNLKGESYKFNYLMLYMKEVLKFQMGFEPTANLEIKGNLVDLQLKSSDIVADTSSYANRPEYKLLKTAYKLEQLNLKNKKMYYLPSIVAFGNIGTYRGAKGLGGIFEKPVDYPTAELNSVRGNFYMYNNYGISASMPIFSGLSQHYKVQQSRIKLKQLENNIDGFKRGAYVESSLAQTNRKGNIIALENQKRNLELAEKVRKTTEIKYKQGVGSNLEVVTAQTDFQNAQTNYYTALYDLIIAEIDYQKSTGNLYKE